MEKIKENICIKLKALRKRHGYSQEDIAALLNMGQNTYSQLEAGKTRIDIERLQQIANYIKLLYMIFWECYPPIKIN